MSVWTTKALDRDREYIVLKHTLKGLNTTILGVKFRGGFAVVEKNSKSYHMLKKFPILKNSVELPLLFLKDLPFITRVADIKLVYGQDVYRRFLTVLEQEQNKQRDEDQYNKELQHLENNGCLYRTERGTLCSYDALDNSPSKYCKMHILDDSKLAELGIEVPRYIAKDEKDKIRSRVLRQLEKVKVTKTDGEDNRKDQE